MPHPSLASNIVSDEMSVEDLARQLETLKTFVARRFDEISMEINATSQIMGMTEDSMNSRFGDVLGLLNGISTGSGTTPHNVGEELETVRKASEDAANTILDSVDAINAIAATEIDWADPAARQALLAGILEQTNVIVTACAFQDLTGQRIGRTLENIRHAEDELNEIARKIGIKVEERQETPGAGMASQTDIDALFD